MRLQFSSRAMPVLFAVLLVGCSSQPTDRIGLALLQSLVDREPEPVTLSDQEVDEAVIASLAATDAPLILATFQKTENNVILREIARNGPFRTWSDAGTSVRRNISTRNGMLTSTRGLAQDLMSSNIDQSLELITAQKSGTATRVQRYLDGENRTYELLMRCDISRADDIRVRSGEIDRPAVQMVESCQSDDRSQSFANLYAVDASGRILQSVQWLNNVFGIVVIQQLR